MAADPAAGDFRQGWRQGRRAPRRRPVHEQALPGAGAHPYDRNARSRSGPVTAVGERAAPTTPNASPKWWSLIGRRWEAADFVVVAAAALVVVIFAVFIGLCIHAFGSTVNTSKTRAMAASETIAQEMDWLSGSVLAALDLVDAKLSLLPTTLEPTDKADLDAALAKLPVPASLAIYDPRGLVV